MSGWIHRIEKWAKNLAAFSLFSLMILMTTDVVGRTVFAKPISGTTEICQYYLLVACVFLALSYTYSMGGHVRVEILATRFGGRFVFATDLLAQLIGIFVFLAIGWFSLEYALEGMKMGSARPAGDFFLPVFPARFMLTLGSILMIVNLIASLVRTVMVFRSGR